MHPKSLAVTPGNLTTAALVAVAGCAFVGWIWTGGGDHWPQQDPRLPLAACMAGAMFAALALAAALERNTLRSVLLALALVAGLFSFMGGDLPDRSRFDAMRPALERDIAAIRQGGACTRKCSVDAKSPLRVAFQLDGDSDHWNGVCYDESDLVGYIDEGYSVHRPVESMRATVDAAIATFGGRVHHTLAWGGHWYGCSTRP